MTKNDNEIEYMGNYYKLNEEEKMLIKILKFLDGKKNIVQAVVAVTATYLADKAIIGTLDAVYIATISGIIFGTASLATTKYLYSDK